METRQISFEMVLDRIVKDEFVKAQDGMREQLIEAALNTQNKTERMNIRMSKKDMENLKMIALREGLPYQSLVTSVLHK